MTIPNSTVWIERPNGATLTQFTTGTSGHFMSPVTLPQNGTYTVHIDPQGSGIGHMSLDPELVPGDPVYPILANGVLVSGTNGGAGQNALFTFTGSTNQKISLVVSNSTMGSANVSILKPDGSTLVSNFSISSGSGYVDTTTLPANGTYTIKADPSGTNVGSADMRLYTVPAVVTGSITPNGGDGEHRHDGPGPDREAHLHRERGLGCRAQDGGRLGLHRHGVDDGAERLDQDRSDDGVAQRAGLGLALGQRHLHGHDRPAGQLLRHASVHADALADHGCDDAGVALAAPAFVDLSPTLDGHLVRIEPLAARHEEGLRDAAADQRTWRWMPMNPTADAASFHDWMTDALDRAAAGLDAPFCILRAGTDEPLGSTRYLALRPEHKSLEIGWTWLSPAAWGTGANAEAKLLLLEHAFERLGCMRVEFKTDALNERSRAALLAIGAQFEGIHRRHMLVRDGELRDSAWYSVIDDEWPATKAALAARVAEKEAG